MSLDKLSSPAQQGEIDATACQRSGISEAARRLFRSALRNTNIDRTDRMIRDLIDVNQIRAGKQLPLRSINASTRDKASALSL